MSSEDIPSKNLDDYYRKKNEKILRVDELKELVTYKINKECKVTDFITKKTYKLPEGYGFFIFKAYPKTR